ncbi:hypothetical protein PUN28_005888 [Cardiocondyla obscurior]|uniref:Uncharacterized protein n=1 Tax=Cardiocondyla obscurior TaxID=286306 RepID=A0AAW2G623_9HYME
MGKRSLNRRERDSEKGGVRQDGSDIDQARAGERFAVEKRRDEEPRFTREERNEERRGRDRRVEETEAGEPRRGSGGRKRTCRARVRGIRSSCRRKGQKKRKRKKKRLEETYQLIRERERYEGERKSCGARKRDMQLRGDTERNRRASETTKTVSTRISTTATTSDD